MSARKAAKKPSKRTRPRRAGRPPEPAPATTAPECSRPAGATTPLGEAFDAALDRLRWQRRLFVRELLVDRNAAAAYRRAGYRAATAEAAAANASRLIADDRVAEAIRLGIADIDARLGQDAEQAARENFALATSRLTDIVTWDEHGLKVKPSSEIPDLAMATVKKVRVKRTLRPDPSGLSTHLIDEVMEFELHDKNSALDRALRMFGRLKADAPGSGVAVTIVVEGTPGLIREPKAAGG